MQPDGSAIRANRYALTPGYLYDDPITALNSSTAAPPDLRLVVDRLSDRLAARLVEQIRTGALGPGDQLPTEQQLAATHGVSRTVVREAVHQLK